jgi:hypothetical protein
MRLAPRTIGNCLIASLVVLTVAAGLLISAFRDGASAKSLGMVATVAMVRDVTLYNDLQRMSEPGQAAALSAHGVKSLEALRGRMSEAQRLADKAMTEESASLSRLRGSLLLLALAAITLCLMSLQASNLLRKVTTPENGSTV